MTEKPEVDNDEISLLDIYEFFLNGWKTLVGFAVLGLAAGFITAFVLPEKFQASALIESASVAKKERNESIGKTGVESAAVLAEKMKVPTYYRAETIQACGLQDGVNSSQALVNGLKPSVARNSSYVSVSFKAESPAVAKSCLESVLKDVVDNQAQLAKPLINNLEVELANAEQELQANTTERDQQRIKNREKLSVARSKLAAAEAFVAQFSKDSLTFKFGDPQFSATALLLSTLISKQNEIKDLEIQINALELEVAANMTDKDQAVRRMSNVVAELKNALQPPNTKPATFAAPIYTPSTKVEPKRSIVILVGLIAGGFIGLVLLVGMRVRNSLRQQLKREAKS
jgi:LPS O-antigen subunit length determinant protein (WzzB/FepE family)